MSDVAVITQFLIASGDVHSRGIFAPISIGIRLRSDTVFWGDFLGNGQDSLPIIQRLIDLCEPRLIGLLPENFRYLWGEISSIFPPFGKVGIADGVRAAVQHALLQVVANFRSATVTEILCDEYGLKQPSPGSLACPLFLEVSDFAATAELIDTMLRLRPDGIGYRLTGGRVAEAIGENGEYLQRFVRQLGQRAILLAGNEEGAPALYLGLNGALGELSEDPIRHIGKVLGNCVGLQEAAGERRLILEDPIYLSDSTAQSSNMQRLKNLIRRTPSSLERRYPTLLVNKGDHMSDDDVSRFVDTQAVHALVIGPIGIYDVDRSMTHITALNHSELGKFLYLDERATHRWIKLATDIAFIARSDGLIISLNDSHLGAYTQALRYRNEMIARHTGQEQAVLPDTTV